MIEPWLGERGQQSAHREIAIAAPHPAAVEAGLAAFRAGGTAVDAAVAATATLAVVYPQDCSIGGDLIALFASPLSGPLVVNGAGAAARAASAETARARGATMPEDGVDTITVPGAVAGWDALRRHGGRLPLATLLEAPIAHARDGVAVAPGVARAITRRADRIQADPGLRAVLAPKGNPLTTGDALRQPALAQSLEAIAAEGPDALYSGAVGARLVEGLRELGSRLDEDDFAAHRTEVTAPLRMTFADCEWLTAPPPSQGFVLFALLRAISALDALPDPLDPSACALLARLCMLAAADADAHLGDPVHVAVPLPDLLSHDRAAEMLEWARASRSPTAGTATRGDGDTVAVVALDSNGHAVSLIQSVFATFGSGILEPETGILCHNRGASFTLEPGAPSCLAGGRRPPHTLMPLVGMRDGAPVAAHGTMGGRAQPQIHLGLLLRLARGETLADAIAAPRWIADGPERGAVLAETDAGVDGPLREAGLRVVAGGVHDDAAGHAQLVRRVTDGRLEAASDPRADGRAFAGVIG